MSADLGDENRHCVECGRYVGALEVAKYLNDDTVEDQVDVICNACYGGVLRGSVSDTSADGDLAAALRAWANGWLPQMAAVEFVLGVYPNLSPNNSMVRKHAEDEGGGWYLDVYCDEETWQQRTAHMSGGERATWWLARSLARGELSEHFSRLDAHRRLAFSTALEIWNLR